MRFTTKALFFLALATLSAGACKQDSSAPVMGELKAKTVSRPAAARFVSCLSEHTDFCSLLTPELLHSMLPQDSLQVADSSAQLPLVSELRAVDNLPELNQCVFSWNSKRMDTLRVDGYSYPYPVSNEVGLGEVRIFKAQDDSAAIRMARNSFERMYRNQSELETDSIRLLAEQDMLFANDSLYISMDRRQAYNDRYTEVPGLADTAVWDAFSHKLILLEGPVIFKVMAQVHDDEAQNRELAVNIAREVLKRCR